MMHSRPIDPAPRRYPDFVYLYARAQRGPSAAPETNSVEDIMDWLIEGALGEPDLISLFETLVWRAVAAGLSLDRASLHVGTLHPQLLGFAWNWNREDGFVDEVRVEEGSTQTDAFKRNPLFRVIRLGERVRRDPQNPAAAQEFPLMAELRDQGFTDYIAEPLNAGETYHNAVTIATKRPGGFDDRQIAGLRRIFSLFALHIERHKAIRISSNILDTYLGSAAGAQVLQGSIKRGTGAPIEAIVWASDLRNFTDLSDRLSGPDMIVLLNAYFECLVGAIVKHQGEVLKFIGDGLLAVFPFNAFESERDTAHAALGAAEDALIALDGLNTSPPPQLATIEGWAPLRTGIALHQGEVFFGNVGAAERLDFTVIGPAVNAAARVEALSKTIGRSLLVTQSVACRLDKDLEHLGDHRLRGVQEPISLFSPKDSAVS